MTDDDGFLTTAGLRWFTMLAFVAACALVGYMGQHEKPRDDPAAPSPTTTTSTTTTMATTTTTVPAATTTTSTPPPATTTTTTPAPRAMARATWAVSSTVYCLDGITASGEPVGDGIVAVSYENWPRLRGTRWRVTAGPPEIVGRTYRVADKGPDAEFDVWMGDRPDCPTWGRYTYGRKPATVVPA